MHNEMQSGIQDPALRYDHYEPGQVDHSDGPGEVMPDTEVREDDE